MTDYSDIRALLYNTTMEAVDINLIRTSAGNISIRTAGGHMAITPTSIKYNHLGPDQIAIVDLQGNLVDGPDRPSSETPMHTAILRECSHVNVICHTHSVYAMTMAVLGREIPVINTEMFVCGGPIPVARWASPGSEEAGVVCVEFFNERPKLKAMLLRNHGVVSVGKTLDEALARALDVETSAQVYHQACQLGEPLLISEKQQQQITEIYAKK